MPPRFLRRLAVAFVLLACAAAHAATLRVANRGDVLSMDPHSLFEALQVGFLSNVYEPLVSRRADMTLEPALATRWWQPSPTVWRFALRRGVVFHDGTPFDADDVLFSFARAAGPGSDLKSVVAPIKAVRKVDPYTVEIETAEPLAILPQTLTIVLVMSRQWSAAVKAEQPVDRRQHVENAASFRANGTGPYRLVERQPGTRTALQRHAGWWGTPGGNVDRVEFMPVASDATRVAALLSGEVDVIEPVPLQDVARLEAGGFAVMQGPELRTLFLGMDQQRDGLLYGPKDRNPFKDRRVRQAVYQAIDIETIRSRVMRGAATPTAQMIAPGVHGYPPDLAKRLPYDPQAARTLLAEAGYAQGFEVALHCPNDRYVNDLAICEAVAAQLARVGIQVRLQAESKALWFPRLLRRDTSFYLFGWSTPTNDALNAIVNLIASPDGRGRGQYNAGGYANARIDRLAAEIEVEPDDTKRNRLIHEALQLHQQDIGHVPLHQQALAWGLARGVRLVQPPDDTMRFDLANVSR